MTRNPLDRAAEKRAARELAAELADLQQAVRDLQRKSGLAHSAIDNGALRARVDERDTLIMGHQYDGTNIAASVSGPVPPTPYRPTVTPVEGGLRVEWSGTFAATDGSENITVVAPMDFTGVDVVVATSPTANFIATPPVHRFTSARGSAIFLPLPTEARSVALVTRTAAGVASAPSAVVTATALPVAQPSDGTPPALPAGGYPAPSGYGGVAHIVFRWAELPNADPVTYRLHVRRNGTPTTDGTYEVFAGVGATSVAVRALKDGSAVTRGASTTTTDTYTAVVTFEDADTTAATPVVASPPSDPVSPVQITSADIAANVIQADMLAGRTLTGATVETQALADRGVKLGIVNGVEGLFVFDSNGVPFLKAVPAEGMAVVAGEVKANTATVTGGSSLGGTTEITRNSDGSAGIVRLTAFTTAPKSAPIVTSGYDTVQYANDFNWAYRYGWATDGTYWYTANNISGYVERYGGLGAYGESIMTHSSYTTAQLRAIAVGGGSVFVLSYDSTKSAATQWAVDEFNATTFAFVNRAYWVHADGTRDPAMWWDPTSGELLIAQSRPTNGDKVRIRRYFKVDTSLVASTTWVDCNFAYAFNLAGVSFGPHDFGGDRYIFSNSGAGSFRVVLAASGAEQATDNWASAVTGKAGFAYTGGVFVSMDDSGVMRTYTGIGKYVADGDITLVQWVANTLANATYETDRSPRAKITVPKRSKIFVTTSPINVGGANSPDRVRIYIGNNATDPAPNGMAKYPDPPVGATTISYSALVGSNGTNGPPTVNGFETAGGTVQRLEASSGGFSVDGQSNGSVGTGSFRDSMLAAAVGSDPWHTVGAAGEPAFQNGWTNANASAPMRFRKDGLGNVIITGIVNGGTARDVFFLPATHRPSAVTSFPTTRGSAAGPRLDVSHTGDTTRPGGVGFLGTDFTGNLAVTAQFPSAM